MSTKTCKGSCGETKNVTEFSVRKKGSTYGYRNQCKKCRCNQAKKYYEEHKEERNEYSKKYHEEHREELNQKHKEYCEKNKERIEQVRKEYREVHRKELSAQSVEYERQRRKTDPMKKLKKTLRSRIYNAIHRQYGEKANSSMELIGCTIQEVRKHIESQFVEGMTWDNHGEWHVDHIRPCVSFNLEDPEEQKKCFHFTNLQPLWAEDNFRKSGKFSDKQEPPTLPKEEDEP